MAQEEIRFEPSLEGGVVVGYDGSERGAAALAWGARDAERRGVALHVVRAWLISTAMDEVDHPYGSVPSVDEIEAAVRRSATAALERALEETGAAVGTTAVHVVHSAATRGLMAAASQRPELLVVADRGKGGFLGLSLGSTAAQLVAHAPCTVVVVRPR